MVGISYPASGCGRTSRHISFSDKQSMSKVGQMFEYGVRSVQLIKGANQVSTMTTAGYRIPFLADMEGTVQTGSGTGVAGVQIRICHIDADTGVADTDSDYCPLQTFITDKRGQFKGEIRVSNVNWVNQIEYFIVTPYMVETMADGTIIEHEFAAPSMTIAVSHLGQATLMFRDKTSVSVFGSVAYDPNIVAGNN